MLFTRDVVARTGLAISAAVFAAACASSAPTAPTSISPQAATVSIMGSARLTPAQVVAWFNARQPGTGSFAATVPVATLAQYFIEEGAAERVSGDVAFMQSVVETGWFRFNGVVRASANNFAGIGATDINPSPALFPDAQTGVRAQIQHLRAYADPTALTCTVPPLANPCVDPRFHLVTPKGRAPTWNQMGNGNWATASTYASSILGLYADALAFSGTRAISTLGVHVGVGGDRAGTPLIVGERNGYPHAGRIDRAQDFHIGIAIDGAHQLQEIKRSSGGKVPVDGRVRHATRRSDIKQRKHRPGDPRGTDAAVFSEPHQRNVVE